MKLSSFEKKFLKLLNIDFNGEHFVDLTSEQEFKPTMCSSSEHARHPLGKDITDEINEYKCGDKIIYINRAYNNSFWDSTILVKQGNTDFYSEEIKDSSTTTKELTIVQNGTKYEISSTIGGTPDIDEIIDTDISRRKLSDNTQSYSNIKSTIASLISTDHYCNNAKSTFITSANRYNYKYCLSNLISKVFSGNFEEFYSTIVDIFTEMYEHAHKKVRENPEEYLSQAEKKLKELNTQYQIEMAALVEGYKRKINAALDEFNRGSDNIKKEYIKEFEDIRPAVQTLKKYLSLKDMPRRKRKKA